MKRGVLLRHLRFHGFYLKREGALILFLVQSQDRTSRGCTEAFGDRESPGCKDLPWTLDSGDRGLTDPIATYGIDTLYVSYEKGQ